MTKGSTWSEDVAERIAADLAEAQKHLSAAKRRALKAKMLRALREANGDMILDSFTALQTSVDASFANEDSMKALEALKRAITPFTTPPKGKGQRKREGSQRRRQERLKGRRKKI